MNNAANCRTGFSLLNRRTGFILSVAHFFTTDYTDYYKEKIVGQALACQIVRWASACRFSEDRLKSVLQEFDRQTKVCPTGNTGLQTKVCPTGTLVDRLKSVLQKDGESCGNR